MLRKITVPILALAAGMQIAAAAAATGFVAGDSIGEGIHLASGLPSVANHSGASIRRTSEAVAQISQAAPGSVVFLSLGTNDAIGSIEGLDGDIDRIVDAAAQAKVHLIWVGPPCVFKPWDRNAKTLDGMLQQKLKGTAVTYVSMRDDTICDPSLRWPKEGVHFTMPGYHRLWEKAQAAASADGFEVTAGTAVAASSGTGPKTAALHRGKGKKYLVRRKKGHEVLAQATAPSAAPSAPASPKAKSLWDVLVHGAN